MSETSTIALAIDLPDYRQPCGHCGGRGETDNPAYLRWVVEHPEPEKAPGLEWHSPEEKAFWATYDAWMESLTAFHKLHGPETFPCQPCQGSGLAKLPWPTIYSSEEDMARAVEKLRALYAETTGERDAPYTRADVWLAVTRLLEAKVENYLRHPEELYAESGYQEELDAALDQRQRAEKKRGQS